MTLQHEIDLKSDVEETLADMGTKEIMEWLTCYSSLPEWKKS
jgi:hypothetical protein